MRRPPTLCVWSGLVLALCLARAAAAGPVQRADHVYVEARRVQGVRFEGAPWERVPGGISASGLGRGAFAGELLGEGDFRIEARLSLATIDGTGAHFRLGESLIGLDGPDEKLFVDGPLFDGKRTLLVPTQSLVTVGRMFELEVERKAEQISVRIDNKPVHEGPVSPRGVGRFGFVPERGTIVLERFVLHGKTEPLLALARDPGLQAAAEAAVEKAIGWLGRRQQRDGSWRHLQYGFPGGATALSTYTLLRAGCGIDHPSVERALLYLGTVEPEETYTAGLMLMAYEATHASQYEGRMRALVAKISAWNTRGEWGYPRVPEDNFHKWLAEPSGTDLSNTQYAVLGLRAAHHAGIEVPARVWTTIAERVLEHAERARPVDGLENATRSPPGKREVAGFSYNAGQAPTGSMTCAGISVLSICRQVLGPTWRGKLATDVQRAIDAGLAWISANYTLETNPGTDKGFFFYYLYGLERVGTLTERESLGEHDWYREGAEWLVKRQREGGFWSSPETFAFGHWLGAIEESDTCFAVLFLKRASRPSVSTGDPFERELVQRDLDRGSPVHLRTSGRTNVTAWIGGFDEPVHAAHKSSTLGGLRVAAIEYVADGKVVARFDGAPERAWEADAYPMRHTFDLPGPHTLQARVELVPPEAPADARIGSIRLESRTISVQSDGRLQPWMRAAALCATRDQLLPKLVAKVTASSQNGEDERAEFACDGLESTRWVSKDAADVSPTIVIEFDKPVRADRLVLCQGASSPEEQGRYDRIRRVAVRLNRDKDLVQGKLVDEEACPSEIDLGRVLAISRLEIRVLERVAGTQWAGHVSLTEIGLERTK